MGLRNALKPTTIRLILILLWSAFVFLKLTNPQAKTMLEPVELTPYLSEQIPARPYQFTPTVYSIKISQKYRNVTDPRVVALKKYLEYRGSPMAPYAEIFVKEADKNGLDWRILVAISGVESNFGLITPYNSYNAWGWRGGPHGSFSVFQDWRGAIVQMSKNFAQGYGKDPNPYDIESTYCPPCGEAGTHAWAAGVTRFKNEITKFYNIILKYDPNYKNTR